MLRKINWQALSNDDRNKTIEEVKEAIFASDGFIMNFNMFSDMALSLSIEIQENKILQLHQALSSILRISDFDQEKINNESRKEWLIFINLSFGRGTGDIRMEIPSVPG